MTPAEALDLGLAGLTAYLLAGVLFATFHQWRFPTEVLDVPEQGRALWHVLVALIWPLLLGALLWDAWLGWRLRRYRARRQKALAEVAATLAEMQAMIEEIDRDPYAPPGLGQVMREQVAALEEQVQRMERMEGKS